MAAQEAGVDAHRLCKRVLRALDSVFRLRRGWAAPGARFRFEAERRVRARKNDSAIAVQQLVHRLRGVLRALGDGAVDSRPLRLRQNLLYAPRRDRLHQRLQHLLGDIPAGGQPVQKQQSQPLPADRDLPGIEIRRTPKARLHVLHAPMRHGFASCLDDSSVIFPQTQKSIPVFRVTGLHIPAVCGRL